ncbi:MAG: Hsp20/alpha crystallin family protein [Nitrospirota bacterium]
MKIIKWDPFKDVMTEKPSTWSPAVDVYETEKEIVLTAELPGVSQEDIVLTVLDNVLTLKGDRRFERDVKHENFYRIERNYGNFHRKFSMPCDVDSAKTSANFNDGLLKVVIPKVNKVKKVPVKVER